MNFYCCGEIVIAFDEVERKPNFGLWLCRVGFPVYGYALENPHSCKDKKTATPLNFWRGISRHSYIMVTLVNWHRNWDMW